MRLIIEARLEGGKPGTTAATSTIVDVVEQQDGSGADLGQLRALTLPHIHIHQEFII